jgi:hypothetical protein
MDLNSIKSKLNALQTAGQKKEKVDFSKYLWKPKSEGKFQIRFVPSKHDPSNPFKEIFVHYGFSKFPVYALSNWGEKDPIIEFAKQLRQTSDKENWRIAKKLDPKLRVFAPVIVRGEESKGVRLWEFGKEIYLQLLGIADDEDYGDYTDINEGRDFTVEAVKGDVGGREGLKCSIRIKPKTTPLSNDASEIEKWLNDQPDILEMQKTYKQSFEKIKELLQNWLEPNAEENTEEVVEENDEPETPTKPYALNTSSAKVKKSKLDKFDEVFEDDTQDLPWENEN